MKYLNYVMLFIVIATNILLATVPLTIRSGTTRNYPQTDDLDWGDEATNWAQDVTAAINASPQSNVSQTFSAVVGSASDVSNSIATHTTISSAISAASVGGNIYILDGTYWQTSTLTIDKSLTIVGQSDRTVIAAANNTFTPIIDFTTSGITLEGLRLDEGFSTSAIGIRVATNTSRNRINISAEGFFTAGLIQNNGTDNSVTGTISFQTSDSRILSSKINNVYIRGTENKILTLNDSSSLNQNLLTTSIPTFKSVGLTDGTLTANGYNVSVTGHSTINQNVTTTGTPSFTSVDASTYKFGGNNVIETVLAQRQLSGIQTVDSTTESAIENQIDTLPSLTSVQGQSITLSGSLSVDANSEINQSVKTGSIPTFKSVGLTDGTLTVGGYNVNVTGHSALNQDVRNTATPSFQTVSAYQWNGSKVNTANDINLESMNNIVRVMGDTANNTENKYVLYGSDGNGTGGDNSSGLMSSIDGMIAYKNRGGSWITVSAVSTANQQLSNLSSVSVNTSLIPSSTHDIGASGTPWGTSYVVRSNATNFVGTGFVTSQYGYFQTVGILNNSPAQALDVTGNIKATGFMTSSIGYWNTVGIGTSLNAVPLHVKKNATGNSDIFRIENSSNASATDSSTFQMYVDDYPKANFVAYRDGTGYAGYLGIDTADNDIGRAMNRRLTITPTALGLGVSTFTSGAKFQSLTEAASNVYYQDAISDTSTHSPLIIQERARGTNAVKQNVANGDRLGGVYFRGWATSLGFTSTGGIVEWATGTITNSAIPSDMVFYQGNGTADTEVMRLKGANQRTGFGTTDPTVKVDIRGTIKIGDGLETAANAGAGAIKWATSSLHYSDGVNWNLLTPAGQIIDFAGSTCPAGFLSADGSAISRTSYANLFTNIGTTWGTGDGVNTFNIPDLRGIFTRGAGTSGKLTNANSVAFAGTLGTYENDKTQGHIHRKQDSTSATGGAYGGANYDYVAGSGNQPQNPVTAPEADGVNGTPRTGTETNPAAATVTKCIRY